MRVYVYDPSRKFARKAFRRVDDEELKRLWPTRLPDKELASRLGHHIGVVRRRAKMIGLPPRRVLWATELT